MKYNKERTYEHALETSKNLMSYYKNKKCVVRYATTGKTVEIITTMSSVTPERINDDEYIPVIRFHGANGAYDIDDINIRWRPYE